MRLCLCVVGSLILRAASALAAQPHYYVLTDLGHLPGGAFAAPIDLNDSGQVTGQADVPEPGNPNSNTSHGFLWDHGSLTEIGTAGYTFSTPSSINNSGQIVGRVETSLPDLPNESQAFIYDGNGLRVIGQELGFAYSKGYGINDAGVIVGSWSNAQPDGERPFRYDGQNLEFVPTLTEKTEARQINNLGQVVGYTMVQGIRQPFLWDANGFAILDLPTGGVSGGAVDINDLGQAVGHWADGQQRIDAGEVTDIFRAALYQPNGFAMDIGTLGGDFSAAAGINDQGYIVGLSEFSDQHWHWHAFLYHGDQGMLDLNDRIHPGLGWELRNAIAINDVGQIVGYAQNQNGFLLTPADPGDADLDGDVDLSDLGALATNYGASSAARWWTGDFDSDGDVDLSDLGLLATNYGAGQAQAFADFQSLSVPEPALATFALCALLLRQRSRLNKTCRT